MLLSPLHVLNRKLRRGLGERRSQLLLIPDSLLSLAPAFKVSRTQPSD